MKSKKTIYHDDGTHTSFWVDEGYGSFSSMEHNTFRPMTGTTQGWDREASGLFQSEYVIKGRKKTKHE